MKLPKSALYWISDAFGLTLQQNTKRVTGTGRLPVPLNDKTRLICKLDIVADWHNRKTGESAVVVHVRGNLYLLLMLCEDMPKASANLFAVDATKVEGGIKEVFKKARSSDTVTDRITEGEIKSWRWEPQGGWVEGAGNLGG
jgi:hypothetical protein